MKECKLKELATIIKGQQLNKTYLSKEGTYYVLNGGILPSGYTENYNTKSNTISISEGGNCGFVTFNEQNFWSGGHNYTLQNLKINVRYLYQNLKKRENFIMTLGVGSALKNIQKNKLNELIILYHQTKNEQTCIASLLSLIDKEISILEGIISCLIKIRKYLLNLFLKYTLIFGCKKNFSDLFEEIKIKNNNLLPQFTVGKHGIKKITEIKYQINNHKVFFKNCLLVGLGLNEIEFSNNASGCISPIYKIYQLKNHDYLDSLKYTIKSQLWLKKKFISKQSTRREYEINHKELKKNFINVNDNNSVISFSQSLSLVDKKIEITKQQKEKIEQIRKYLLHNLFV